MSLSLSSYSEPLTDLTQYNLNGIVNQPAKSELHSLQRLLTRDSGHANHLPHPQCPKN